MSTKIYNAFRMSANSLDEVVKVFFDNKSEMQKDIELHLVKEVLLEMVKAYDRFSLEGEGLVFEKSKEATENIDNKKNPYSIIMDKFWDKENPDNDALEKEVSMIIYPESIDLFGEKNYLMQLYCDSEISKVIHTYLKKWGVEEYNYWNNTDKPDEVTDHEWSIRQKHWSKIDSPLLSGISITFLKSSKYEVFFSYTYKTKKHLVHTALEDVLKECTIENRINQNIFKVKEKIAYKECYDIFITENQLENVEQSVLVDMIIKKGMRIYLKSVDKARNNDFNEAQLFEIAEKSQQIETLLKDTFILEDFDIEGKEITQLSINKLNKKLKLK